MMEFTERTDWLTVFHLPSYAPDVNPVEGIGSTIRRGVLANLAAAGLDHLIQTIRRGMKQVQYRPDLINGCLGQTGLTLNEK
ncbi:hypothetical protein [Streptomyces sp. NPDC058394]|uniref:hypothetical protein n=1 Tax=Streptomyces sp. NPDC058394 TaxID=3346477 RepID=UPI003668866A